MSFERPPHPPDQLWRYLAPRPGEPNPCWSDAAALFRRRAFDDLSAALARWDAVVALGESAFRDVNVAESRPLLASALAGFVALAKCASAAQSGDPEATARHLDEAARHFAAATGLPPPPQSISASAALPDLFDRLDALSPVADVVRSALATLTGEELPHDHALQVPVLFAVGRVGRVGFLHFERSPGRGAVCQFVPHLARLGFQPFDASFRESARRAWELVRPEFPPGSRVRWWLSLGEVGDVRGDSAGAAFAAGLYGLAKGFSYARVGVTGSLETDGRVGRVGGHLAKAASLAPDGVTRFITARGDKAAADLVRLFYPAVAVHEIDIFRDAVPTLRGEADAAAAYLAACRREWALDPWSSRDDPYVFLGPEFVPPAVHGAGESLPRSWHGGEQQARGRFASAAVLGGPGSGKSTLLRYEGWLAAGEQLAALAAGASPQHLTLPILANAAALAERTHEPFAVAVAGAQTTPAVPAGLLRRERVLLLIDGWDELPEARLDPLLRWLGANRPGRVYVAARHAGASGAVEAAGGTRLEVAEWTAEQGWRFARGRFDAEDRFRAFADTLRRAPRSAELLRVPLLAALACRAFSRHGEVPQTPAELLAEFIDGLFGVWRVARRGGVVRSPTDAEARAANGRRDAAARLARELAFKNPARNTFGLDSLHAAASAAGLPAGLVDELIHGGLLVRVRESPRLYAFPHRPLRDFLLAWALAGREDWRSEVAGLVYNPEWRDVLALVGGAMRRRDLEDDPEGPGRAEGYVRFLAGQARHDVLLRPLLVAARAASELPASPLRGQLADALVRVYLSPVCPIPREELVGPLAGLGPEVAVALTAAVRRNPDARRNPWDDVARREGNEPPDEAEVWGAVNVRRVLAKLGAVGRQAAEELAADPDAEVAAFALTLFQTPPVPQRVVERAVQLLAPDHPPAVRRAGAELLAIAPSVLAIPKLLADPEEYGAVERRLVAALAATLVASPDALFPLLTHPPAQRSRLLAAVELAFRTTPQRAEWVAACIASPVPQVRLLGLRGVDDSLATQSDLFEAVARLAVNDTEPAVRAAAVRTLPTFGAASLPLLRELAPGDTVAACGLARHDSAFAAFEADRLLTRAPAPILGEFVRHGVFTSERVRHTLLQRVLADTAEALCELVQQLAEIDASALPDLGDRLAERLRDGSVGERSDLLDAAWVCLNRSPVRSEQLLHELSRLAPEVPMVEELLRTLDISSVEPPADPRPTTRRESADPDALLAALDSPTNRLDVVAALWQAAPGTALTFQEGPSAVRELVELISKVME